MAKAKREIVVVEKNIEDLKTDFGNPRKIMKDDFNRLKESLKENNDFGVIVINEKDQVISGNQRIQAMRELKWDKPILCKQLRGYTREELMAINIRANQSAGKFDEAILVEWLNEIQISEINIELTGFTEVGLNELQGSIEEESPYTRKILSPHYEPSGEKPDISDLVNNEKVEILIGKIKASKISGEEKDFLIKAAQRHLLFDYQKIANYYAHSGKEVQELMERSALIIIDYEKAIEQGFVDAVDQINEMWDEDD